jgi:myosin-5
VTREDGGFSDAVNDRTSILNTLEEFVNYLQDGLLFSQSETDSFLSILKGIIFLGEIKFSDIDENEHLGRSVNEMIHHCSLYFELDYKVLSSFLMEKSITVSKTEKISSRRSSGDSYNLRDSFASELYSSLFCWIVSRINKNLEPADGKGTEENNLSIALLDIFGFESFKENGIEQLLINYANEKLHYYFISVSILQEQEVYANEGIPFENIFSFSRVKDVLISIEGSRGLIEVMHDQISLQQSDTYLYNQIKQLQQQSSLKGIKADKYSSSKFWISHYAGEVKYSIDGIVDRNQDSSSSHGNSAFVDLLENSSNTVIQMIWHFLSSGTSTFNSALSMKKNSSPSSNIRSSSVAKRFRGELEKIIECIDNTGLSFVKCIKPNEEKAAFLFNSSAVYDQLICNGIIEVCQIKRSIYPYQMNLDDFNSMYHWISPVKGSFQNGSSKEAVKQFIQTISDSIGITDSVFAIGASKVFLGIQVASLLERKLSFFIKSVVKVQCVIRRALQQITYEKLLKKMLSARLMVVLAFRRHCTQKRVYFRQILSARSLIIYSFRRWKQQRRIHAQSFLNKVARLLLSRAVSVWRNKIAAFREEEIKLQEVAVQEITEASADIIRNEVVVIKVPLQLRNTGDSEMILKYPKLEVIQIDKNCGSSSIVQPSDLDILVETIVFVVIYFLFLFFC